jgi:hypothetical protein
MFWIFKIFPDWFWWLLLIAGLSSYFLSHLIPVKSYAVLVKNAAVATTLAVIFIFGLRYADGVWTEAAKELQHKVEVAQAQSATVNETIKTKVVVKTQVIKTRGNDIVTYVDREVAKGNSGCVITPEFITAHNRAAEQPK